MYYDRATQRGGRGVVRPPLPQRFSQPRRQPPKGIDQPPPKIPQSRKQARTMLRDALWRLAYKAQIHVASIWPAVFAGTWRPPVYSDPDTRRLANKVQRLMEWRKRHA